MRSTFPSITTHTNQVNVSVVTRWRSWDLIAHGIYILNQVGWLLQKPRLYSSSAFVTLKYKSWFSHSIFCFIVTEAHPVFSSTFFPVWPWLHGCENKNNRTEKQSALKGPKPCKIHFWAFKSIIVFIHHKKKPEAVFWSIHAFPNI